MHPESASIFLRRSPLAWAALACLSAAPVLAQTSTAADASATADSGTLATVVVTAAGREQDIKDAPASITVVTREEIEKMPAASVLDVVRRLEGVNISTGIPSETEISIRGMPGEYTLLLVDGKRQNSRETMNRGTAGVQTNLLPPLSAIERIEVVRGPMSSLYGSDAIGGVVNIITRKVPQKWSGSVEAGVVLQQHSELGDGNHSSFWFGGPVKDDVLGLQIYGGTRRRGEDAVYYTSGISGAYEEDDRNLTVKATARLNRDHDLTAEFGVNDFTWAQTPGRTLAATGTATRSKFERDHWALTHEGRWGGGITSRIALQQEQASRTNWTGSTQAVAVPDLTNTVLDAGVTLPFSSHILKVGGQYSDSVLKGISQQDAIAGSTYAANVDRVQLKTWALYAEDEYFLTDRLTLTGGARIDHDERYGNHWTPRLFGVYKLSDATSVRAGVAKGFKAPTIRQSTAGYCMTSGGPVANFQPPGTLCGNPNLQPETSSTAEVGLHFDLAGGGNFSATAFYNDFKNKVTSYDTGVPDPRIPTRNIYVYENISNVKLQGIELAAGMPLSKTLKVSGNYTYTQSKRGAGGEPAFNGTSLVGQPLDRTPEHVLNAQLDWTPMAALSLYTRLTAASSQQWAGFRNYANGTLRRGGSGTVDVGGTWAINPNLNLKFAVLNLADKIVPVDTRTRAQGLADNWLVDEGRRLAVSLNATF